VTSPLASDDDVAFKESLEGEDELGIVIRAHIFIEAKLIELLNLLLVQPKHLDNMRLGYANRVHLAVAAGLGPQFAPPLLMLGTIRNAFAHKPNTSLSKRRVDELYNSFGAINKQLIQEVHEITRARGRIPNADQKFVQSPSKQRFILMAITLRGFLKAAILQARSGAET
jgi:hypothetical protein